jgi:hypothetical protein
MGIKYYIKAAVSEYQDQAGVSKKRYQTIGIVTETKKGDLMAKIEMIPLLGLKDGSLWCYLNVPEDKDTKDPFPKSLNNIPEDVPF